MLGDWAGLARRAPRLREDPVAARQAVFLMAVLCLSSRRELFSPFLQLTLDPAFN